MQLGRYGIYIALAYVDGFEPAVGKNPNGTSHKVF